MNLPSFLKKYYRIPQSQKIFFVANLRVMLKSGISLARALNTLVLQTENKKFKKILGAISHNVEKGKSFSQSLSGYTQIFDELFINMIKAGETSGKLEDSLTRLYIQMKKNYDLRAKIRGALIYPVIILIAMVAISIGMMVFVIPRFTPLFEEVGATMPLATRLLIRTSNFIVNHGILTTIILLIIIISFSQFIKIKKGKYYFDLILLNLPVISPIIKKINLAVFARTLSSLIKTDIPIVQTMQITSRILNNELYREALFQASEKIKKGAATREIIKNYPHLFPPVVIQMVAVGEESGSLDNILEELAVFYEDEVSQIMNNLPSIIEPIVILVLGIGVAWMAIAVIMPLYSLSQAI